jgi:multidrug efflux pump subunit AcrB
MPQSRNLLDRIVARALQGGIPLTLFLVALAAGGAALYLTPREEEPQIVVPMVDVQVSAPGLSAEQVARQVTIPVEKLLNQIPGVEHLYSASTAGQASVTLRFYVGQDREESILNTYNKLYSNQDQVPAVVEQWLVRPVEVDDVPIVMLALWSEDPARYGDYELRRVADEITTRLQAIPRTSEVKVTGGRPRTIRVLLDPESLAARRTTALEVAEALRLSNQLRGSGRWTFGNESIVLESGDFARDVEQLAGLPVNVIDGMMVICEMSPGSSTARPNPSDYGWIEFASGHPHYRGSHEGFPMVTISVAKQRGSNAVSVSRKVHARMAACGNCCCPPKSTSRCCAITAKRRTRRSTA